MFVTKKGLNLRRPVRKMRKNNVVPNKQEVSEEKNVKTSTKKTGKKDTANVEAEK